MRKSVYEVEACCEEDHWWFVGRRRLFAREIEKLGISTKATVLDVGTSTGTNLRLLGDMGFSAYEGVDIEPEAAKFCADKGLGRVTVCDVCNLPYPDESFDFIMATDILEHIEDDAHALSELFRVLRADGKILITVPAFASMWGLQDEVSHHVRRYSWDEFHDRVQGAGFTIPRSYYFNFLLFAPIWFVRRIIKLFGIDLQSENQLTSTSVNAILKRIFWLDCKLAPMITPPFGVSIFAIAAKK